MKLWRVKVMREQWAPLFIEAETASEARDLAADHLDQVDFGPGHREIRSAVQVKELRLHDQGHPVFSGGNWRTLVEEWLEAEAEHPATEAEARAFEEREVADA